MKKVIEGALYNTATAKEIGHWRNGSDGFNWCKETLFRTKAGKYFLDGEGGANSKYSSQSGNTWYDGERIIPVTPSAAAIWAEEHLDADEYAEIFGEPEEAGDERVALNLTVSAATKARLEKMREDTGKSISQIVEDMILAE